jgi:hypothetical protein
MRAVAIVLFMVTLTTCKGDMGSTGPGGTPGADGPVGPPGPAGPAGFDEQTVTGITALTATTTDIASITITAPSAGFVVLTGSGALRAAHTNGVPSFLRVFLTATSNSQDFNNLTFFELPTTAPTGTYTTAFSVTRVFPVVAGNNTLYMTADFFSGAGSIVRHNLTGIFLPARL